MVAGLDEPAAGYVAVGGKADGLYYRLPGQAEKRLTDTADRILQFKVSGVANATPSVGNDKDILCVPSELNEWKLTKAEAFVTTSGIGTTSIQVRNVDAGVDMLSTPITIDSTEKTSYTATTSSVVNIANQTVLTGALIAIDLDSIAALAKGLGIILTFQNGV